MRRPFKSLGMGDKAEKHAPTPLILAENTKSSCVTGLDSLSTGGLGGFFYRLSLYIIRTISNSPTFYLTKGIEHYSIKLQNN